MNVSIEYIEWLEEERRKINKLDLKDITFFKNGMIADIKEETIEDFRFVGLSNISFITTGHYKYLPKICKHFVKSDPIFYGKSSCYAVPGGVGANDYLPCTLDMGDTCPNLVAYNKKIKERK